MIPWVQISTLSVVINLIVKNEFQDCFSSAIIETLPRATGTPSPPPIPFFTLGYNEDNNKTLYRDLEALVNSGCQCWIMDSRISSDFYAVYNQLLHKVTKQRPVRPKVLFFESSTFGDNTKEVLSRSESSKLPDALLVVWNTNEKETFDYDIWGPQFIGKTNTDHPVMVNSVRIDPFDTSSHEWRFGDGSNLFHPQRLLNLQGRHVEVATFNYYPYSSYELVPPGTGNCDSQELMLNATEGKAYPEKTLLLGGTESLMAIEFCRIFNCTLLFVPDDGGEFGEIYENFTGNGVLGALAMERAEIGFGALYLWQHEHQFVDYSAIVSRTGITLIVPRPHVVDPLLLALLPFSLSLWITVLTCFVLEAATGAAMQRIHNLLRRSPPKTNLLLQAIFQVFKVHILQSADFDRTALSSRLLWTSIIIGGFIIGSSFSGSPSSFMTIPRYEALIEPEVMARKRLPWAATHNAWIYSILQSTSPVTSQIRDDFQLRSMEDMSAMKPGTMSFSVERLPFEYFAFQDHITQETMEVMRVMKEDVYFEYCLIATRNGWYMKDYLDQLILTVAQSGIQKYWLMVTTYEQLNPSVQQSISLSNSHRGGEANPLELGRVAGIFFLLGFGLAFAWLVFVAEVFLGKCCRCKK